MPIGGIWWRTKASTANPPVVAGQKAPALLRAGTSGGELGGVVDPRRQPGSGTRTRRGGSPDLNAVVVEHRVSRAVDLGARWTTRSCEESKPHALPAPTSVLTSTGRPASRVPSETPFASNNPRLEVASLVSPGLNSLVVDSASATSGARTHTVISAPSARAVAFAWWNGCSEV